MSDDQQRRQPLDTLRNAADLQQRPGYPAELSTCTHRYAGSRDGVPTANLAATPTDRSGSPIRVRPG